MTKDAHFCLSPPGMKNLNQLLLLKVHYRGSQYEQGILIYWPFSSGQSVSMFWLCIHKLLAFYQKQKQTFTAGTSSFRGSLHARDGQALLTLSGMPGTAFSIENWPSRHIHFFLDICPSSTSSSCYMARGGFLPLWHSNSRSDKPEFAAYSPWRNIELVDRHKQTFCPTSFFLWKINKIRSHNSLDQICVRLSWLSSACSKFERAMATIDLAIFTN